MNASRQTVFWIAFLVVIVILIVLLGGVLLPFVLGAALAYFLDPLADRLEAAGMSRLWSTIVIVSVFGLVVLLAFAILVPLLANQLIEFAGSLPKYIQAGKDFLNWQLDRWLGPDWLETNFGYGTDMKDIAEKAAGWAGKVLSSVWSGGLALVNFLSLLVVTPVVTFYLLLDWDRIVARISGWLPRDHAETIRSIAKDIDEVISGFVRGQVTVLIILGIFYMVGLTLIGLNFGLLIGLGAGLISFIPFVGPIVGLFVGGTVAVVQFWPDWHWVAAVLGVFAVGQLIEGNVLSPMIVGDRVRLHPVWLIFSLFVFAYLFGFVGMLLAVPLAAAIGVLVRFALGVYLESPLYLGAPKPRKNRR